MARQLRLSLERQDPPTLDAFVRGPSNADAVAAVEAWPAWPGGCLAIVGPAGAGKSHLGQAWARAQDALVADPAAPDLEAAAGRPVLLEDADRGVSTEGLFHLINLAGREGGGLLLTARKLPAQWKTALPDLRSRLNALTVAQLGAPDDALLHQVLEKFFRQRNIKPTDDIYPYLIRRIERSVPAAEAIVRRLDKAADEQQRAISRVLAREVLDADGTLELFE